MAKSDLLKEAIADAKAVKETALANAKIALQEAFAPKIQRVLSAKLREELEDEANAEDELATGAEDVEAGAEELEAGADELEAGAGEDVGDLSIDVNNDGEFDEFDIMSREPMAGGADDVDATEENPEDEYNEGYEHDELELESIIRELEGDLEDTESPEEIDPATMMDEGDYMEDEDEMLGEDIDSIIESILAEEDEEEMPEMSDETEVHEMKHELKQKDSELQEAYRTVKQLKSVINEVNLLNAKLLYTNKLFRNFELNESQKMKVIENFDRAGNTREVKLVFTTLAESFAKPSKKRVVKESYASKPVATTAPKSAPILNEGFELANRWKKLAGLL